MFGISRSYDSDMLISSRKLIKPLASSFSYTVCMFQHWSVFVIRYLKIGSLALPTKLLTYYILKIRTFSVFPAKNALCLLFLSSCAVFILRNTKTKILILLTPFYSIRFLMGFRGLVFSLML